jgi:hypothetical protein
MMLSKSNPFSPLEREVITQFLREQGSSVKIYWNEKHIFLKKEECRFTETGIIFSSSKNIPLGKVVVELYYKKRGICFSSSCKKSGSVFEIPIPPEIYKMEESKEKKISSGRSAITGTAATENNTIVFQSGKLFSAGIPPWLAVPKIPQFAAALSRFVSIPLPSVNAAKICPLSYPLIPPSLRKELAKGLLVYCGAENLFSRNFSLCPLLASAKSCLVEAPFDIASPLLSQGEHSESDISVLCCTLNQGTTAVNTMEVMHRFIHLIAATAHLFFRKSPFAAAESYSLAEIIFLDDSFVLLSDMYSISLGGTLKEFPPNTPFYVEITAQGRYIRAKAAVSSIYTLNDSPVLSLQFKDIPKEDKRFLFENCYGKKYTGL